MVLKLSVCVWVFSSCLSLLSMLVASWTKAGNKDKKGLMKKSMYFTAGFIRLSLPDIKGEFSVDSCISGSIQKAGFSFIFRDPAFFCLRLWGFLLILFSETQLHCVAKVGISQCYLVLFCTSTAAKSHTKRFLKSQKVQKARTTINRCLSVHRWERWGSCGIAVVNSSSSIYSIHHFCRFDWIKMEHVLLSGQFAKLHMI